jgi:iron complex outermembrane receptor protein
VDLNLFPIGLIDHIDILRDGASAVYGSDAIGGVFNVWLIHKFRDVEIYSSYGNTNLGASNDQAEKLAYVLAGTGDDKTDIVVYAQYYSRDAIYSRDRDISSNADFTRFGGPGAHQGELDNRSGDFAGHISTPFLTKVQPDPERHPDLFDVVPTGDGTVLAPGRKTPTNVPGTHPFAIYTGPTTGLTAGAADAAVAFNNRNLSAAGYVPRNTVDHASNDFLFNQNALTPAMAPVDREYLYTSLDRKILDQYLELFSDFKYVRGFWDDAWAPTPFTPDVFTDATRLLGISIDANGVLEGISVPIQNPFNPFKVPDYTSAGGFDPKHPETKVSAAPAGTGFTTGVHYAALAAGLRTDKITTHNYEFTGGLRGNLGEFGDYFKTWQWESGFRYSEDDRKESLGGVVNNNALRAALLDTNPATAFNPFGLNQNSPAVINRVFTTTHRSGKASLTLEDLKVTGDLFPMPAGPLSFALGGEHRTEYEKDQPDALTASRQVTGAVIPIGEAVPLPGFLSTNGNRDVWSLYWEVRVPVTSPTWNWYGFHSLELGYQERFDNYSDFGSTEKPKFLFRWQPIDSSLTLRGTYSEAYHAPALAELYTSQAEILVPVDDLATVPPNDPLGRPPLLPNGSPAPLTPPGTAVKGTAGGNPNLKPEVAYEWTYGGVWSPKFIKGLTLSADFYHIDLRNLTRGRDVGNILFVNVATSTGTLPNGAPVGGIFSDLIQRDPVTGAVQSVNARLENVNRLLTEGLDYAASYQLDTSIFGHGNLGTFTFTFNGNYLDRFDLQAPTGPETHLNGRFGGPRLGSYPRNRWYASLFYDFGGLDTGLIVHYVGQSWTDAFHSDKIREWTTLDLVVNYTFHLPPAVTEPVPGHAKDASKNAEVKEGEDKKVMPVSTADYSSSGWRAWLNNTTITLGMNNVFDQDPPFVASAITDFNGYDQWQANIRGRTWYVALTKRF